MAGRGRPLLFNSVEELQASIDSYFRDTPVEDWAICGLAVHLNTSRQTLCNFEGREDFFDTIKAAKDKVEFAYERRGIKRGNAFDIFGLKNFDWKDTQDIKQTNMDLTPTLTNEQKQRLASEWTSG